MAELTERERAILDLAGRPVTPSEARIRDELDLSATRYYQLLGALIERPEALVYAPSTTNRLLRLRARRAAAREPARVR